MPKKTRKQTRRHRRRRTHRRIPRGGADTFPILPDSKAIEVSTAPSSSDNILAFKGK